MMLVDLVSAAAGSAILVVLFASIAGRKIRRISAIDQNWQKLRVEA